MSIYTLHKGDDDDDDDDDDNNNNTVIPPPTQELGAVIAVCWEKPRCEKLLMGKIKLSEGQQK